MEHLIRAAGPADVPALLSLIRELAAYEREPDAVEATEESLTAWLFGPDAVASCQVAELEGVVVGMALWYVTFSTWKGQPGLWLEDLYVQPALRGRGIGRDLLRALAGICAARGYPRLEWWVLDWNVDAHAFYRSVGARPQDEWTTWRLEADGISALAASL